MFTTLFASCTTHPQERKWAQSSSRHCSCFYRSCILVTPCGWIWGVFFPYQEAACSCKHYLFITETILGNRKVTHTLDMEVLLCNVRSEDDLLALSIDFLLYIAHHRERFYPFSSGRPICCCVSTLALIWTYLWTWKQIMTVVLSGLQVPILSVWQFDRTAVFDQRSFCSSAAASLHGHDGAIKGRSSLGEDYNTHTHTHHVYSHVPIISYNHNS